MYVCINNFHHGNNYFLKCKPFKDKKKKYSQYFGIPGPGILVGCCKRKLIINTTKLLITHDRFLFVFGVIVSLKLFLQKAQ